MHRVALLQEELRQVAAVLAGDAGDQGNAAGAIHDRWAGGHRRDEGALGGNGGGVGDDMSL